MKRILFAILVVVLCFSLAPAAIAQGGPTVGDTVKAGYFEVVVEKVGGGTRVNTGNSYTDLKAEPGAAYFVMIVRFRNMDNRDRMILAPGILSFARDKQEYQISQTETILAEGFGVLLESVNPMMTYRTQLVYKIPMDTVGEIYWLPPSGKTWIHVATLYPQKK